jgi:hypothetical protein
MKTWVDVSNELTRNGTPIAAMGYCRIAFMAGQASVDAASGYDAGVDACEPEILRLQSELELYKKAGHIQIWKEQKDQLLELSKAVIELDDLSKRMSGYDEGDSQWSATFPALDIARVIANSSTESV